MSAATMERVNKVIPAALGQVEAITAPVLQRHLLRLGVRLRVQDGRLRFEAPAGVVTDDLIAQMKTHKADLMRLCGEYPPSPCALCGMDVRARDAQGVGDTGFWHDGLTYHVPGCLPDDWRYSQERGTVERVTMFEAREVVDRFAPIFIMRDKAERGIGPRLEFPTEGGGLDDYMRAVAWAESYLKRAAAGKPTDERHRAMAFGLMVEVERLICGGTPEAWREQAE